MIESARQESRPSNPRALRHAYNPHIRQPEIRNARIHDLWNEFEAATTPEAKFAKAIDRFAAVLHNYETHGRGWRENGIKRNCVLAVTKYVMNGSATLWEKIQSFIESATREGVLQND
jgi:putative hydrolase of HD superfamily